MNPDPLQALIGQWRESAATIQRNTEGMKQPVTLEDFFANRVGTFNQCADELDAALRSLLERRGPAEKDKKDEGDTRMVTKADSEGALPNVTVDNSGFRMSVGGDASLLSKSTAPNLTVSTSENAGECPVHGPIPMTQVVTISMGGWTDGLYCQRCFADLVAEHCHKFTR